jgi:pentapeptide MXKDX repeat protein
MLRWLRSFIAITAAAGLGFAVAGCSNTSSPTKADKMSGDKMSGDKMSGDKMSGDKMGGKMDDKMGDKMKDKP